jgi:hypothetical protein
MIILKQLTGIILISLGFSISSIFTRFNEGNKGCNSIKFKVPNGWRSSANSYTEDGSFTKPECLFSTREQIEAPCTAETKVDAELPVEHV